MAEAAWQRRRGVAEGAGSTTRQLLVDEVVEVTYKFPKKLPAGEKFGGKICQFNPNLAKEVQLCSPSSSLTTIYNTSLTEDLEGVPQGEAGARCSSCGRSSPAGILSWQTSSPLLSFSHLPSRAAETRA